MRSLLFAVLPLVVAGCGGDGGAATDAAGVDAGSSPDAAPRADAAPPGPFVLSVSRPPGGGFIVDGAGTIDCNAHCTATLPRGTRVTLTATSDPGSAPAAWTGACAATAAGVPCALTMTSDTAVGARFASCASATRWSRAFGGIGDDVAAAVATDGAGRVASAGWITGTANPGAGTLTVAGASDVYVAVHAPDGTPAWNVRYGGALREQAFAVAFTPSGDVIVAGRFEGALQLGATALASNGLYDGFVARLDGVTGAPLWVFSLGGSDEDEALAVAVDPSGDVAVAGDLAATATFGARTVSAHTSPGIPWSDLFVAKLAGATGAVRWVKRAGGAGLDQGEAVAFAPNGDVVVAGLVYPNGVDFDGTPYLGHGDGTLNSVRYDAVVARFAGGDGALAWVTELGGDEADDARALAIEPGTGEILVGGAFGATHRGEQEGFVPPRNPFVARLAPGGKIDRITAFGAGRAGSDAVIKGLVPDGDGGVWIAGGFDDTLDLDAYGTLHATEAQETTDARRLYDGFLARLDSTGTVTRAIRLGGYGRDQLRALAVAPAGGVVAAGELGGEADGCAGALVTASGGSDTWIVSIGATPGVGPSAGAIAPPPPFVPPSGPTRCVPPAAAGPPPAAQGAPTFAASDWGGGPILDIDNDFAVGDFDDDGDDDLAAITPKESSRPGVVLYRNDGTGHFTEDTANMIADHRLDQDGPSLVRPLDVDGDGKLDLITLGISHDQYPFPGVQPRLLRQRAGVLHDETYLSLPIFEGTGAVVSTDVDCDGDVDLWPQLGIDQQRMLVNDGTGVFHAEPRVFQLPGQPMGGEIGVACDADLDGAPDLFWFGNTPGRAYDHYLHNDGVGTFLEVEGALPMRPYWPDPEAQTPMAACVDYDRDGYQDLVLLSFVGASNIAKLALWRNQHDGTFEDRSADAPAIGPAVDLRITDLNGDGWPDIIVGREVIAPQGAEVLMNTGGRFTTLANFATNDSGTTILVPLHADADAKIDLLHLRVGTSTPSILLLNTTP